MALTSSQTAEQQALRAVADVTAHLAGGVGSEDALRGVATALARGLRARECRVWVRTPDGAAYMPLVADGDPADPTRRRLALRRQMAGGRQETLQDGAWRLRLPLDHEGARLGMLELSIADGPSAAAFRTAARVVADLLGPLLASSELSADLASEVALRTLETEAQRRFTARIIDSLPVGLYVIDRQYRIQAWNRTRETGAKGVGREEALGRTVFEVLHRQPPELLRQEFDRVFDTGHMEIVEVESVSSGQMRHYRITKIPMRLDDNEVTHVITIGEDVTEWKTVQDQVSQTERLAAIGQLAAGVMHEINNPLATIGACVEALTLKADEAPEGLRQGLDEYLRIIESELARCKSIVDGLLDFSKPKARLKKRVDVNQIVEDALFLVKHHEKFKQIKLVRELRAGLPTIQANAEQLIQVFLALMLNAIDAMEGRGVMTVRTGIGPDRSDEVMVELEDTGVGISRDDLSKIFEPFFTSKQPGRGTGLGLSICYGIVNQHGGRILVDSQVNNGAVFRVLLPISSARWGAGAP